MAQLVLKTSFQGDLRRMTCSVDQVSFQEINDFIAKSYDLPNFVAKYQDEEGDWCTLTLATLTDAIQLAQDKQQLLRLEVLTGGSHSPLPKMASQRSPSECSWEMLDFDDEDAEMDAMDATDALEGESVPPSETIEVTSNTGPAEEHRFPEEIEESEEGADSEDCFLVASQAPASVAETSWPGEDGFLLEPADIPAATAPPAAAEEALQLAAIEVEEAPPENDMAAEPELSSEEKINFILAAFDKNGDGRLNFEECLDLLVWASGELMPFEVFQMTCDELHVDSQQGFGPRELTTLYDCFGTQERDFQAAVRKLTHEPAAPAAAPATGANAPCAGPAPCRGRLSPWMALPLLPICPVAAGAVALAATLRNRTCQ